VKLVISDAHEGIKAGVSKLLCATWQRCRVHFMPKLNSAFGDYILESHFGEEPLRLQSDTGFSHRLGL